MQASVREGVIEIARAAGAAIMDVYRQDFAVEHKDDRSPLTQADLAAHRIIVAGLEKLTPGVPSSIISPTCSRVTRTIVAMSRASSTW